MKKLCYSILNLVYPEKCEVCGKTTYENRYICKKCEYNFLEKSIGKTRNITNTYDIIYVSRYSQIKKYMLLYKFNSKRYIGNMFITLLNKRIENLKLDFDIVTAVPLSKEKRKSRGYNQSEFIAKKIAEKYNKKYINFLYKNRNNVNQSSLNKEQRKENIKGIFTLEEKIILNKEKYKNKKILLIDDVYTTGVTIDECIKIIKEKVNCNIIVGIIAINNNKI